MPSEMGASFQQGRLLYRRERGRRAAEEPAEQKGGEQAPTIAQVGHAQSPRELGGAPVPDSGLGPCGSCRGVCRRRCIKCVWNSGSRHSEKVCAAEGIRGDEKGRRQGGGKQELQREKGKVVKGLDLQQKAFSRGCYLGELVDSGHEP